MSSYRNPTLLIVYLPFLLASWCFEIPTKPCLFRLNFHQGVRNIKCNKVLSVANKSLPANVDVRVRRVVVEVPVGKTCIQPVVPVPTEVSKRAPYIPINLSLGGWPPPKTPAKGVF